MRVTGGGLRELDNAINVHGLDNMSVGYPEETTRLDYYPIYPETSLNLDLKHLRRCRRVPLTHESVNSFAHKYCYVMGMEENCLRSGKQQEKVMRRMLVKQFLPWLRNNLAVCLDDSYWHIELDLFEALDDLQPDRFPKIYLSSCWQAIDRCVLPSHQSTARVGGPDVNRRNIMDSQGQCKYTFL